MSHENPGSYFKISLLDTLTYLSYRSVVMTALFNGIEKGFLLIGNGLLHYFRRYNLRWICQSIIDYVEMDIMHMVLFGLVGFFVKDILPFKINLCELVCFVFVPFPYFVFLSLPPSNPFYWFIISYSFKASICTIVHGMSLPLNSFNTTVCSLLFQVSTKAVNVLQCFYATTY